MNGIEVCVTQQSSLNTVINLDHGDPTIFDPYWRDMGEQSILVIKGHESISYFCDKKNLCWYLEPKLEEEIKRLHQIVGNAVVEGYHVVLGTGSSQLINAVLYALSSCDEPEPTSVVAAAPYYSVICHISKRTIPSDLPNNSPFPYSYTIALMQASIIWALVKEVEVAKKMIQFIEVNTIGVSRESQLRVTMILQVISDGCYNSNSENFFEHGRKIMAARWMRLTEIVEQSKMFSLSKYPLQHCNFAGVSTEAHPAFAWLKRQDNIEDCEELFRGHKIMTRSGRRFGADPNCVRISMVSREEDFSLFLEQLSTIQSVGNGNHEM